MKRKLYLNNAAQKILVYKLQPKPISISGGLALALGFKKKIKNTIRDSNELSGLRIISVVSSEAFKPGL